MSLECSRGAEAQEPCSSKGDRPAHIQRPISGRLQEGAQEQEWTLTLPHSQAPQAEVLRDCPRPGASLTRAGRFLGTTREATGTAFFCGPVGSTEESMGLFINLTLTGQRAGAGKVCRMEHISHYLAPGGSGGRGGGIGASLYTVFLLAQSGAHRPLHAASFDAAAVRCPFQTEPHHQLRASGHDCSGCSSCSLLLWSLRLRRQDW